MLFLKYIPYYYLALTKKTYLCLHTTKTCYLILHIQATGCNGNKDRFG